MKTSSGNSSAAPSRPTVVSPSAREKRPVTLFISSNSTRENAEALRPAAAGALEGRVSTSSPHAGQYRVPVGIPVPHRRQGGPSTLVRTRLPQEGQNGRPETTAPPQEGHVVIPAEGLGPVEDGFDGSIGPLASGSVPGAGCDRHRQSRLAGAQEGCRAEPPK